MKPRLDTGSCVLRRSARSFRASSIPRRNPALRCLQTLDCCARQLLAQSNVLVLKQLLHTPSHFGLNELYPRKPSNTFFTAPRRPRAAGVARLSAPPRPSAPNDNREREALAFHGARQTTKSSSATTAVSLSARLRRSHVLASCPLLYSTTLSLDVVETLAQQAQTATTTVEKEFAVLTEDIHSATLAGASGATAADSASWSDFGFPLVTALCGALHRRGTSSLSEAAFLQCYSRLAGGITSSSVDAEMENTVTAMVRSLVGRWSSSHGAAPSAAHVEATVRTLLENTSTSLLPALLEALQVHSPNSLSTTPSLPRADRHLDDPTPPPTEPPFLYGSEAAENFHGGRRWHPYLSDAAVKSCLQRVVQLLSTATNGEKRRASEAAGVTPVLRHRLQRCCVCQLPSLADDRTRHDCAVLTMGALKGAAFPTLVAAYNYFVEAGLASVPVAQRFLTNCGMCVPHVTQHGVSLSVYLTALAPVVEARPSSSLTFSAAADALVVPGATLAPLLHARQTLLDSGLELKLIQGGLVHMSAALNALGYAADVRAFYARRRGPAGVPLLAELQETPHSVMSFVHLRRVGPAVAALAELGASRPEGWVSLPSAVVQCMEAVSHLVGAAGTPAQVDELYVALIGFHNGAFFTSHHIELVLAGVCDRVRDLPREGQQQQQQQQQSIRQSEGSRTASLTSKARPHEVLDRVIPVVRATLRYIGDELNADMILELVETALHVDDYAVSLTAALVWAFRAWMDLSLCLQELLCRVDASTHNVPFLHYYALCHARDFCSAAVFDHLAALWHVDGDAIWHRVAHLSPSCQLWKCTACGRLNSDRYNYCLCSALRYSHVLCGTCGYAQDERVRQCLSCGAALLSAAALSGAIARKSWSCGDCGARNPAKQTLLCFRCGQPTGPRFRDASPSLLKSFCGDCHTRTAGNDKAHRKDDAYAAATGVCHKCGRFKMDYAAHHSAVWVCAGCQQRRSTLERICPSCPQVECLPHAVCRESITEPRVCRHCQHDEANPFTLVCSACGSSDEPFRKEQSATATAAAAAGSSSASTAAEHEASTTSHWCFHCQHLQPWKGDVAPQSACCDNCGAPCEERGRCALPPRSCGACGAAVASPYSGSAVCPFCAAYTEPAPQPTAAGPLGGVWSTVTVLHTCEVLDSCCAREARLAAEGPMSDAAAPCVSSTSAPTAAESPRTSFLQRRPMLERTLNRLLHEWVDAETSGLGAVAWLSMRVDVAMVLGRALNRLRQHLPYSLTARRLSALFKTVLTHIDALCGAAATRSRDAAVGRPHANPHFTSEERCHDCLGTHPPELCPFRDDGGSWTCGECGTVSRNDDVGRYVCAACLTLRPVVQDLLVSTCWTCHACHRANMQFERYCIHCGVERATWSPDLLPQLMDRPNSTNADDASGGEVTAGEVNLAAAARDDEIPFTPAKCHLCGLVYIETRCPLCQNHIPDVADAKGTVCDVRARYAYIQPVGTTRLQDRIFVDETLLQANPLREGLEVHYTAELGARGRMQATFLRC